MLPDHDGMSARVKPQMALLPADERPIIVAAMGAVYDGKSYDELRPDEGDKEIVDAVVKRITKDPVKQAEIIERAWDRAKELVDELADVANEIARRLIDGYTGSKTFFTIEGERVKALAPITEAPAADQA